MLPAYPVSTIYRFSFILALTFWSLNGIGSTPPHMQNPIEPYNHDLKREEARNLVKNQCGHCHTPNSPTAIPKALKVFSLSDANWTQHMSIRQLDRALWMMRERLAMTPKELGYLVPIGTKIPKPPTRVAVDKFESFIHDEIDARQRLPGSDHEVPSDSLKFHGH